MSCSTPRGLAAVSPLTTYYCTVLSITRTALRAGRERSEAKHEGNPWRTRTQSFEYITCRCCLPTRFILLSVLQAQSVHFVENQNNNLTNAGHLLARSHVGCSTRPKYSARLLSATTVNSMTRLLCSASYSVVFCFTYYAPVLSVGMSCCVLTRLS